MAFAIGIYKSKQLELTRGSFILVEDISHAEESVEPAKSKDTKSVEANPKEEAKKVLLNYIKLYGSLKAEAPIKLLKSKLDVEEDFVIELIDELESNKQISIRDGVITILKGGE